jgi:site-specific recombinase XerD
MASAIFLTEDENNLRGQRDSTTLSILLGCGIGMAELTALRVEDLRQRQEHWAILKKLSPKTSEAS